MIDEELGTSIAHTRFNSFSRTYLAALVLGTAIFLITLGAKAADVFILILLAGMLLAAVAGFWCIRFVVERLRRKVYGEEAIDSQKGMPGLRPSCRQRLHASEN